MIGRSDVDWQKRGELTEAMWMAEAMWIGRSKVDWQKRGEWIGRSDMDW